MPISLNRFKTKIKNPALFPEVENVKNVENSGEEAEKVNADSTNEDELNGYDLSDPTAVELLLDEDNPEDSEESDEEPIEGTHSLQIQKVQKTLLSVEIARQKGVEFQGERICLPGRAPLSLFTLLELLFGTLGFAAGFIHFTAMAKNFLLAQFVIYVLLVMQILIYHSCYRALRTFMTILQTIGTLGIMSLVGWAFYDLIVNPLPGVNHHFFLGVALVCFALIPVLMVLHLVYFGRGYRYVELKRKPKASEKPTKILKTPYNTPTQVI